MTNNTGNIATSNLDTRGGTNGSAGNITLDATNGDVNVTGSISAQAGDVATSNTSSGGNGGTVSISSINQTITNSISTSGSNARGDNQTGGNAGDVNLNASGAITTRSIASSGGSGGTLNSIGGSAGNISITSTGAGDINVDRLTIRSGAARGTAAGGAAGSISVNNTTGNISTQNLDARGNSSADAGDITLTTTAGNVNVVGSIVAQGGSVAAGSTSDGGDGGTVNITSANQTITSGISTSGGAARGDNQTGGNAGDVNLNATGAITARGISSTGGTGGTINGVGGNAGNIAIRSTSAGDISTDRLSANNGASRGTGAGGNTGGISVINDIGNINTRDLRANGNTNGDGGSVNVNAVTGDVLVTGQVLTQGGNIVASNTARGSHGGSINISSVNQTITGTVSSRGSAARGANQNGGNAGNVTLNATGTIQSAAIIANTGNATDTGAGGNTASVTVTGTEVTTGNISVQGGRNSEGGSINVTSTTGGLTVGSLNTSAGAANTDTDGRNAGQVSIDSAEGLTVSNISARGSSGRGTNRNGGDGGIVNLSAGNTNTITMRNINTRGGARTGTGTGGSGGDISVANNALLSANTSIDARGSNGSTGGTTTFSGTIDSLGSNRTLTINNNGTNNLEGAIGSTLALQSIRTASNGNTVINGGSVTTIGTQTYDNSTSLGSNTTFNTSDSNVRFNGAVTSNTNDVVIDAGTGSVTGTNAANDFNNLSITSASNVSIRDNNEIELGASTVSGNYTLRTNSHVTQSAPISVAGTTTINSSTNGDVTLDNSLNDFNRARISSGRDVSLIDQNAITIDSSSVRSMSVQTLSDNLTLAGNIIASGSTGTPITLVSANDFITSGDRVLRTGTGGRWLVYSNTPENDVRSARMLNEYDFKQYNTSFGDAILGNNDGFIYRIAPTVTATLNGAVSKTYDANTAISSVTGLSISQSGSIDGDTVTLSGLTGAMFDNKNVGTNKLVTSNTINITGQSNAGKQVFGYQLANSSANGNIGTITPAILTLNAVTDSKVYDGNTSSNGLVTNSSLIGGDSISNLKQSFNSQNVLGSNASTINVDSTYTINDGNNGNNYTVTSNSATGTITPRAITVTADTGQNKQIGTADPVLTFSTSNLVFGDNVNGSLVRTSGESLGSYAINQGSISAGNNYTINYIGGQFSIVEIPAPTVTTAASNTPRDEAGLGNFLVSLEAPLQGTALLNISATGAGGTAIEGKDVNVAIETCEENNQQILKNPNTSVIFNFGLKLPQGVQATCI